MDSVLQSLVCSAGALSVMELQNIFQVWPWHRVSMGSDPQLERCPPPSAWCKEGGREHHTFPTMPSPPTSPLPP